MLTTKKPIGFLRSARLIPKSIMFSLFTYQSIWWAVLLSLFFYLIGLVGVRHSRTLSRYHYDALLWGTIRWNFVRPTTSLGGGGFATRFTQCSTYSIIFHIIAALAVIILYQLIGSVSCHSGLGFDCLSFTCYLSHFWYCKGNANFWIVQVFLVNKP